MVLPHRKSAYLQKAIHFYDIGSSELLTLFGLEAHHEVESYAPFVGIGQMLVGDAPHIVNSEELENVVDAHYRFPIWLVGHDVGIVG